MNTNEHTSALAHLHTEWWIFCPHLSHKPSQTFCRTGTLALTVAQIRCHSKSLQEREKTVFMFSVLCMCVFAYVCVYGCCGCSMFAESSRNCFIIVFGGDTQNPLTSIMHHHNPECISPFKFAGSHIGITLSKSRQDTHTQTQMDNPHTCRIDSHYKLIGPTSRWGSEVNLRFFTAVEQRKGMERKRALGK